MQQKKVLPHAMLGNPLAGPGPALEVSTCTSNCRDSISFNRQVQWQGTSLGEAVWAAVTDRTASLTLSRCCAATHVRGGVQENGHFLHVKWINTAASTAYTFCGCYCYCCCCCPDAACAASASACCWMLFKKSSTPKPPPGGSPNCEVSSWPVMRAWLNCSSWCRN